jgi:predicted Zn-dependent peptidase
VTRERLEEVARRYVKPDDLAIVVVGDAKALEPALARFGTVKRLSAAVSPSVAPQAPAEGHPHP